MKSMTGFGKANLKYKNRDFRIIAKSQNNKYLKINSSIPNLFPEKLTYNLEKLVKNFVKRGSIYIKIKKLHSQDNLIEKETIKSNIDELIEFSDVLSNRVEISKKIRLFDIIYFQNSIESPTTIFETDKFCDSIIASTQDAIKRMIEARGKEGKNLEEFFISSINKMEVALSTIELSIPEFMSDLKKHVEEKLNEIYKYNTETNKFNEEKILSEINYYIDKSEITEEIVRLKSHLDKLRSLLTKDEQPIGHSLLFTIQEMQREINTISAKYNKKELFSEILTIKNEINKCKEQAYNVE